MSDSTELAEVSSILETSDFCGLVSAFGPPGDCDCARNDLLQRTAKPVIQGVRSLIRGLSGSRPKRMQRLLESLTIRRQRCIRLHARRERPGPSTGPSALPARHFRE